MPKSNLKNALRSLVRKHGFERVNETLQEIGLSEPDIVKSNPDQAIVDKFQKSIRDNTYTMPNNPLTQADSDRRPPNASTMARFTCQSNP